MKTVSFDWWITTQFHEFFCLRFLLLNVKALAIIWKLKLWVRNNCIPLFIFDFFSVFQGNKKGPIGRWDFDTAEEYADYMSKKEALPKAAFQYGVKMNEGRKTRGKVGAKNDKAKLDKEWNKISSMIDKRKTSGGGGGSMPKIPKFDK